MWVVVSEHNIDEWPNGGLLRVSDKSGDFSYGFIPRALFERIKEVFILLAKQKK